MQVSRRQSVSKYRLSASRRATERAPAGAGARDQCRHIFLTILPVFNPLSQEGIASTNRHDYSLSPSVAARIVLSKWEPALICGGGCLVQGRLPERGAAAAHCKFRCATGPVATAHLVLRLWRRSACTYPDTGVKPPKRPLFRGWAPRSTPVTATEAAKQPSNTPRRHSYPFSGHSRALCAQPHQSPTEKYRKPAVRLAARMLCHALPIAHPIA